MEQTEQNFCIFAFVGPIYVPFFENPNSHFYPFFNACLRVQFQKDLIDLETAVDFEPSTTLGSI